MLVVMKPFVVVIVSQLLFTAGDLLARLKMRQHGFDADAFVSWWLAAYVLVRTLDPGALPVLPLATRVRCGCSRWPWRSVAITGADGPVR
jgi:hypothetical protein